MPDASGAITLSAALISGVAGSVHCFVMCGGLAGALGMRRPATAGGIGALGDAAMYHVGRVGGYTIIGAIFGGLGATVGSALDLPKLAMMARVAAGLLLVLVALRVLVGWNALAWLEWLGARFWISVQPLARRLVSSRAASRNLLLGLLWGWLPCGLVYSMLLFAALTGDALRGGGIMLAFGLGTLPAMLASTLGASRLTIYLRQSGTRRLSGALLLVFGLWLAYAAIPSTPHANHGNHLSATAAGNPHHKTSIWMDGPSTTRSDSHRTVLSGVNVIHPLTSRVATLV